MGECGTFDDFVSWNIVNYFAVFHFEKSLVSQHDTVGSGVL